MHNNKSLSRELSLISLGLIKDKGDFKLNKSQIEEIVEAAFRTIISAGIVNPDEKNNTTNPNFSKLFSQLRASTNTSS